MNERARRRREVVESAIINKEYDELVRGFWYYLPYAKSYKIIYAKFHGAWQDIADHINNNKQMKVLVANPGQFMNEFKPVESPDGVDWGILKWIRNKFINETKFK